MTNPNSLGAVARKSAAPAYKTPLAGGSPPTTGIEEALQRIEGCVRQAAKLANRPGEAARLHGGRAASSSDAQLRMALQELEQLRALLTSQPSRLPDGCVRLQVVTRHPQDYVLVNEEDGTSWRGTAEGKWTSR